MRGMSVTTGKPLEGMDHLRQSITDILRTPIGSRVMRRDYGSRLFELVDAPLNGQTVIDLYAATVEALQRWEPRIVCRRVQIDESPGVGRVSLTLYADYRPDGQPIRLDGIVL